MSSQKLELKILSIEDLEFLPENPRSEMYDDTLIELSKSITREGLIEPIVARPKGKKYEVVVGERRVSMHACMHFYITMFANRY